VPSPNPKPTLTSGTIVFPWTTIASPTTVLVLRTRSISLVAAVKT
jgi:hypothetical protein